MAIVISICCDTLYLTMETVDDISPVIDATARYLSGIAIFAYPTWIRCPLGWSPSKYYHNV